jgi:hypothetical protein
MRESPERGGGSTPGAESNPAPKGRVSLEQRLKLGFSVSPEFMAKYNRIKALLSSKHPDGIDRDPYISRGL